MARKSRLIFSLILLLICSPVWATDYTQDANCVGAYLFDEGSGTTLTDSSPNGNNGSFLGTGQPAWDSSTLPKSYTSYTCLFDGSNDIITFTDAPFQLATPTIIFWVRSPTAPGNTENNSVVWKTEFVNEPNWQFYWDHTSAGSEQSWLMYAGGWRSARYTTALQANTWYHMACYTSAATKMEIYLNGINEADNTFAGNASTGGGTCSIGNGYYGAANVYMVEYAVFSDVLSSTEINDIMDNGLKPAGGVTSYLMMVD